MDPFSAIGLAGNIIQFVDFSCKLITGSRTIYHSADGATEENITLHGIARDLEDLSEGLETSRQGNEAPEADGLRSLAADCKRFARGMLQALEELRAKNPQSKWQSFKAALKQVWSHDQVQKLASQLTALQNQLLIRILHLVQNEQSGVVQLLRQLEIRNEKLHIKNFERINEIKLEIRDAIQALQPQAVLTTANVQDHLASISLEPPASPNDVALFSERVKILSALLSDFAREGNVMVLNQLLLQKIDFPAMKIRYHEIPAAHVKTFSWVLDPPQSGQLEDSTKFVQWLRAGNGIFWIMGKAGSGKSTLMKYIWQHPKTLSYLKEWSSGEQLVTAYHFFWNSGTNLQKSQEGLLRSLLFEVLRQCPQLIPETCLEVLKRLSRGDEFFWTQSELVEALGKLLEYPELPLRVCFFIDGLDEYDTAEGNHTEIVALLQKVSACSSIKLCVSSRPWFVFLDAFGQHEDKFLKLEDLTRNDIQLFVHDKLTEHPRFKQLQEEDQRYIDIEMQIVATAKGVFLWVFLVCRSLVQGLTNADRISDLQRRLDLIPKSLEKFFQHMLESVESIYKRQTSETFQVALHADGPLSLLTYSFLDEEDPDFSLTLDVNPLSNKEVVIRHENMRRRLDGRCKGLLEVHRVPQQPWPNVNGFYAFTVDFIHRTARDFLLTKDMQKMFQDNLPEGFSAQKQSIKSFLAQLKTLPQTKLDRDAEGPFESILTQIMETALQLEEQHPEPDPELFLLLEEAGNVVLRRPQQWRKGKKTAFTGRAIEMGLFNFTKWNLEKNRQMLLSRGRPLLDFALLPSNGGRQLKYRPDIVELLLLSGADPNQSFKDSTVWVRFISKIRSLRAAADKEDVTEICALLIAFGADLGEKIGTEDDDIIENPSRSYRGPRNIRSNIQMQVCLEAAQVIQEIFGEEKTTGLLARAQKNSSLAEWFPWIFSGR